MVMNSVAPNVVLIIGSGLYSTTMANTSRQKIRSIVAINNAWRVRSDWDFLLHPQDFPEHRRPQTTKAGQVIHTYQSYVPAQNAFGGFVYAGGTMAFTTAYWALYALKPDVLAFVGCDMVYPTTGNTHFYGVGAADPLREDITLQNLEAKANRLQALVADNGCYCLTITEAQDSRLTFPSVSTVDFLQTSSQQLLVIAQKAANALDRQAIDRAKHKEQQLVLLYRKWPILAAFR